MTARECLFEAQALGEDFQRVINVFLDDFLRADTVEKPLMIEDAITTYDHLKGLIAGVVSALCRAEGI